MNQALRALALCGGGFWGCANVAQGQVGQLLVLDSTKVVRFEYPTTLPIDHFVGPGISKLEGADFLIYGPDGNLYVSSSATHSVLRFNGQTGQFKDEFVKPGSGGLSIPTGIAFGPDGKFYVASIGTASVLQYNGLTGAFIKAFVLPGSGGLSNPRDVAFDGLGNCFVASATTNSVLRYNAMTGAFLGTHTAPPGKAMDFPLGLCVDAENNVYVSCTNSANVLVISSAGTVSELVKAQTGGLGMPGDMTIAPEGWLLVGSSNSVGRVLGFDRASGAYTGTFVFDANDGGLGFAHSLAFVPESVDCYADCDGSGSLNIDDFICFQTLYAIGC